MHVPFRRPRPWGSRLATLTREPRNGPDPVPPLTVAPPERGGTVPAAATQMALPTMGDLERLAAEPALIETLPLPALTRALQAALEENRRLRARLKKRKARARVLETRLQALELDDAEIRGRLRTLDEVIAALQANVEDLRLQRDSLLARG